MNRYCLRWEHLIKGFSVEHDVRRLLSRVSFKLSSRDYIRANLYLPALDIDCVDIRVHLQSANSHWSTGVEVSVRSSSKPVLQLGSKSKYGTIGHWLDQSRIRRIPCIVFFYDWKKSKLIALTPAMIRDYSSGIKRQSVQVDRISQDVEEFTYLLFRKMAQMESEEDARLYLS